VAGGLAAAAVVIGVGVGVGTASTDGTVGGPLESLK
jgi:hypothetical protein